MTSRPKKSTLLGYDQDEIISNTYAASRDSQQQQQRSNRSEQQQPSLYFPKPHNNNTVIIAATTQKITTPSSASIVPDKVIQPSSVEQDEEEESEHEDEELQESEDDEEWQEDENQQPLSDEDEEEVLPATPALLSLDQEQLSQVLKALEPLGALSQLTQLSTSFNNATAAIESQLAQLNEKFTLILDIVQQNHLEQLQATKISASAAAQVIAQAPVPQEVIAVPSTVVCEIPPEDVPAPSTSSSRKSSRSGSITKIGKGAPSANNNRAIKSTTTNGQVARSRKANSIKKKQKQEEAENPVNESAASESEEQSEHVAVEEIANGRNVRPHSKSNTALKITRRTLQEKKAAAAAAEFVGDNDMNQNEL